MATRRDASATTARTTPPPTPAEPVIPLDPDEVVLGSRVDADGTRYVVTSAGRKVALVPGEAPVVVVGPPFTVHPEDADA